MRTTISLSIIAIFFSLTATTAGQNYVGVGGQRGTPVKAEVLVLADNQFAFDYGGVIDEQQYGVNRITSTARRNAISNMYTLDFLEEVISSSKAKLVLHAGDAMNNGCRSEFMRFKAAMKRTALPWFMAPGNHDVSYLGISHPKIGDKGKKGNGDGIPLNSVGGWGGLCFPMRSRDLDRQPVSEREIHQHVFTKRNFIREYLRELKSRARLEVDDKVLSKSNEKINTDTKVICNEKPNTKFLNKICWYLADENKSWNDQQTWEDFLVQEVRWRNKKTNKMVSAILVDTSNFKRRPTILRGCWLNIRQNCNRIGGIRASILEKQRSIIEDWLQKNLEQGVPTIIVSHHPFRKPKKWLSSRAVNPEISNWSSKLAKRFDKVISISAHTHSGYVVDKPKKKGAFAEFNVGSLIDLPLESFHLNWSSSNLNVRPQLSRIFYSPVPERKLIHKGYKELNRHETCKQTLKDVLGVSPILAIQPTSGWLKPVSSLSKRWKENKAINKNKALISQLKSLQKEAFVFSKVLAHKGDVNSSEPVCYRIKANGYGCGTRKANAKCALARDINRCSVSDRNQGKFVNLAVIASHDSAIKVASKLAIELREEMKGKFIESKAYRLRREAARKLHAIALFDEQNPAKDAVSYRMTKACLAQVAGHAQQVNKRWWNR